MYESSQNKKPSWTPTTVQKKGKSPSKLGHFSIQPQPHHTPAPSQENGEYKRPSGNRITENIIRGFQAKEQELAEGSNVQRKSESPWAPTFEPAPPLPQDPASKLKGAFAPVSENQIQRQCAECAREMVEQKMEKRKDLDETGIQTKLTIGAPGDAYEQEADQVAAQVMSMPDNSPHVQKYSEANYTNEIWQRAQSIKPVVQRVVDPSVEMGEMVQRAHQMGGNQPFSQPSSLDANNTHEIWKRAHSIKPVVQRVVDPSVQMRDTEVNNDKPWESTLHQDYEYIAKEWIYFDRSENEQIEKNNVYIVKKVFKDDRSGLDALGLDRTDGQSPVIAFRGTFDDLGDLATDFDPRGHGYKQFQALQEKTEFESWLTEQKMKPDVIGHSLGGALAQLTAANYPDKVGNIVTFNSPGIDSNSVDEYKQSEDREGYEIYHYIAEKDPISNIGEAFLPGYEIKNSPIEKPLLNWSNWFKNHSRIVLDDNNVTKETSGIEEERIPKFTSLWKIVSLLPFLVTSASTELLYVINEILSLISGESGGADTATDSRLPQSTNGLEKKLPPRVTERQ